MRVYYILSRWLVPKWSVVSSLPVETHLAVKTQLEHWVACCTSVCWKSALKKKSEHRDSPSSRELITITHMEHLLNCDTCELGQRFTPAVILFTEKQFYYWLFITFIWPFSQIEQSKNSQKSEGSIHVTIYYTRLNISVWFMWESALTKWKVLYCPHLASIGTSTDSQVFTIAIVLNLVSIEPQGFGVSVSGVRRRSRHTPDSYVSWWHRPRLAATEGFGECAN